MIPILISTAALLVSLTALFFTFRKDAHRVRLEINLGGPGVVIIGVNNDSACSASVLSVGYFGSEAKVHWLSHVGNYKSNSSVSYPICVDARSLLNIQIIGGQELPASYQQFGYCVQLATGRVFVVRGGAPGLISLQMHFASLISRITAGRWVPGYVTRPRLLTRD